MGEVGNRQLIDSSLACLTARGVFNVGGNIKSLLLLLVMNFTSNREVVYLLEHWKFGIFFNPGTCSVG